MTTQPQRDPAPQALSEAELKLALNDLHRHHPSVADKVAQHISALQTQLHHYKSQSGMWEERSRVWFAELERTKSQLEYAQGYKESLEDVNQTLAKERDTARAQLEQAQSHLKDAIELNIKLREYAKQDDAQYQRTLAELAASREQVKVLTRYAKHYPTCFKTSKALEHNDCNCGLNQALQAERNEG